MTTIGDILSPYIPFSERLAAFDVYGKKVGATRGLVFCKVFFASNLKDRVCRMGQTRIARSISMDKSTVSRSLAWGVEHGFLELVKESTPTAPAHYRCTELFYAAASGEFDNLLDSLGVAPRNRVLQDATGGVAPRNQEEELKEDLEEKDADSNSFESLFGVSSPSATKTDPVARLTAEDMDRMILGGAGKSELQKYFEDIRMPPDYVSMATRLYEVTLWPKPLRKDVKGLVAAFDEYETLYGINALDLMLAAWEQVKPQVVEGKLTIVHPRSLGKVMAQIHTKIQHEREQAVEVLTLPQMRYRLDSWDVIRFSEEYGVYTFRDGTVLKDDMVKDAYDKAVSERSDSKEKSHAK